MINTNRFSIFTLSLLIALAPTLSQAQTASILPNAQTTFVDKNGKPLTSGTVEFFIPGTTTHKMTWKDAGQTISNANPLTLDGSGRAIIFGDGSYRQLLKDRYGNVIWDAYTSSAAGSGGGSTPTVGDGDAVGVVKPWSSFVAPYGYVFAYGQELARASYPEAFAALTSEKNITCASGNSTLTGVSDTSQLAIGSPIESSCLNAGATIISKTVNSVVVSSNAIISATVTARFFPYGNGDGSSTFNVPDLRGITLAGRDNMGGIAANRLTPTYFANATGLGQFAGSESRQLNTINLPPYTPSGSVATTTNTTTTLTSPAGAVFWSSGAGSFGVGTASQFSVSAITASSNSTSFSSFTGSSQGGTQTPFAIVQPTRIINYIIKIIPDSNPNSFFGVASIGGMYGVIECGTGVTCAGNTISAVAANIAPPTPSTLGGIFQSNAPANQFAIGVDLAGNILYSGGSTTVNGQICAIGGSCTISASAGTITVGTTTISSGSANALLFNNGGTLGNVTTANNSILATDGSGVPSWVNVIPSAVTASSLTSVGTLTSGGTGTGFTLDFTNSTKTGVIPLVNGGSGQTTAALARAPSGFNIDQLSTVGDTNTSIASTTRTLATTVTLTSSRTFTLPLANSVNAGQHLYIIDQAGAINGSNVINVSRSGSDTINGSTSLTMNVQYGGQDFISDGVSKWTSSVASGGGGSGDLLAANNLSDVSNTTTSRANLRINKDYISAFDCIPVSEQAAITAKTSTYDATSDLQSCLDTAAGQTLILPPGLYNVSAALTVTSSTSTTFKAGPIIKGSGMMNTIINYDGVATDLGIITMTTGDTSGLKYMLGGEISDLSIQQTGSAVNIDGIRLTAMWLMTIKRVQIQNITRHGLFVPPRTDININSDYYQNLYPILQHNRINGAGGWCIRFEGGNAAGPFDVSYNQMTNCTGGGFYTEVGQGTFKNNVLTGNGTPAGSLSLTGGMIVDAAPVADGGPTPYGLEISHNEFDTNYIQHLKLKSTVRTHVTQNRFLSNEISGVMVPSLHISLGRSPESKVATYVTMEDNAHRSTNPSALAVYWYDQEAGSYGNIIKNPLNIGAGAGLVKYFGFTTAANNVIIEDNNTLIGVGVFIANSTGSNISLNNTANYFDGPQVAQGTFGTFLATGTVTLSDTAGAAIFLCKLWDGTNIISSGRWDSKAINDTGIIALSGVITSPANNIKISCRDSTTTTGIITYNYSGNGKDSTVTAIRIK